MDEITIRRTADRAVLTIRHAVPADMLGAFIGGAIEELYGFVGTAGIEPEGSPMARYHAFGPAVVDVEVCLPVAPGTIGAGRIGSYVLPAADVATMEYVGPYDRVGDAHASLAQWVARHGHKVDGPALERYLVGPDAGIRPSEYRTEIELPIAMAAVATRA